MIQPYNWIINNCIFKNNIGSIGGAINFFLAKPDNAPNIILRKCIFSDNLALASKDKTGLGGAIYYYNILGN
jgi:hypothetical protein